jgi:hypothetical protein
VEEPDDQGGRRARPGIAWLTTEVVPLAGSGAARRLLVSAGPDEARRRLALRGLFSAGRSQLSRRASGRSNAQLAHTIRAMAATRRVGRRGGIEADVERRGWLAAGLMEAAGAPQADVVACYRGPSARPAWSDRSGARALRCMPSESELTEEGS